MSGIDQMKAKIKKKMTLNDLPSPEKSIFLGEPTVHTDVQPSESTAVHLEVQPEVNTSVHPNVQLEVHPDVRTAIHKSVHPDIQQVADTAQRFAANTEIQQTIHQNSNTVKQHIKTLYPKKMTMYLTEELYKTFNDIYAQRIIEGRKTDKSELICEAVRLLAEREGM